MYKDPSGNLTIIVPGTYFDNKEWSEVNKADFQEQVSQTFQEEHGRTVFFNDKIGWTGGNDHISREDAAENLAGFIAEKMQDAPKGEKINIVAHSHGGNVVKIMTEKMGRGEVTLGGRKIDNAVNLGTPQRDQYNFDRSQVGNIFNIFSKNDKIQTKGGDMVKFDPTGNPYDGYKGVIFEMGPAGRKDKTKGARNIEVSEAAQASVNKNGKLIMDFFKVGHSDLHNAGIFKNFIQPEIEKVLK